MEQSFQKGVVLHLASLIEYTEGGVISKQLIKSPAGNITLFSFDKGEGLSEHRAPFDALVQVLEGVANITVNGTLFTVKAGESIVFPANAPHALTAVERFKMLLSMITSPLNFPPVRCAGGSCVLRPRPSEKRLLISYTHSGGDFLFFCGNF